MSVDEMMKRQSDLKYDELTHIISEGNFVFIRSIQNWLNLKTKLIEKWEYYDLFRVENNKVVEHWVFLEN